MDGSLAEELLSDSYVEWLRLLAMEATDLSEPVRTALAANKDKFAMLSIWGKRAKRTLRELAQHLQRFVAYMGGMRKALEAQEHDVINWLTDLEDEPCGKTTPGTAVKCLRVAWEKLGLPTLIGSVAQGVAERIAERISEGSLKAERKALQLPMVAVVS